MYDWTPDQRAGQQKINWDVRRQEFGQKLRQKRKVRGISVQTMARVIGVHHSQISRWERGISLPSFYPLIMAVADCYSLNEAEKKELCELAFGIAEPHGISPSAEGLQNGQLILKLSDELIQRFEADLIFIHDARISGNPTLTDRMASARVQEIEGFLPLVATVSHRKKLLETQALLLYEQRIALFESYALPKIKRSTNVVVKKMLSIARVCDNENLFGLAHLCMGDYLYIQHNEDQAIDRLTEAQAHVKDPDEQLRTGRLLILSYAYQKSVEQFLETEAWLNNLIQEGKWKSLENYCQSLEGLGRGQGLFGFVRCIDTLQEVRVMLTELAEAGQRSPFRDVQWGRSMLEVWQHLKITEVGYFEQIAQETLRLAEEFGYPRHVQQTKRFVESLP